MKQISNARPIMRYLALDIHREYVMVGGMNAAQEWVLRPRRVEMERFRAWAEANLREGDVVVLEATTNVWDIYDIGSPLVSSRDVKLCGPLIVRVLLLTTMFSPS